MTGRETSGTARHEAPLRFVPIPPDTTWERERDTRLAEFLTPRLSVAEATGCTEERRYAAGVRAVFGEWNAKRVLVLRGAGDSDDLFAARVSALGWVLRCLAHPVWHNTPGWQPGFHPQAVSPATTREVPA